MMSALDNVMSIPSIKSEHARLYQQAAAELELLRKKAGLCDSLYLEVSQQHTDLEELRTELARLRAIEAAAKEWRETRATSDNVMANKGCTCAYCALIRAVDSKPPAGESSGEGGHVLSQAGSPQSV